MAGTASATSTTIFRSEARAALAALLLLSACAARGPAAAAPEPWREAPGPGWVMIEPVRAGRAVFIEPAAVKRDGTMRGATVVLNNLEGTRTRTGQAVRSLRYSLEVDCARRLYAPVSTAQFEALAARGEPLATASLEDLAARPVVAGSVAEQILDALCAPEAAPQPARR
ncbi:MAG: hypothetical protein MUC89_13090 [Acetobacteraceae bacterium]|nr:hypothetical protein [Acetobacteraceae bacterium]